VIFDRSSKTPESSEELVGLIDFINSARNVELVQLTDSVKVLVHFANLARVIRLSSTEGPTGLRVLHRLKGTHKLLCHEPRSSLTLFFSFYSSCLLKVNSS